MRKVDTKGLPSSTIRKLNKIDSAYIHAIRTFNPPELRDLFEVEFIQRFYTIAHELLLQRSFYNEKFYHNNWTLISDDGDTMIVEKYCCYDQLRLSSLVCIKVSLDYKEIWYVQRKGFGYKVLNIEYPKESCGNHGF